MNHAIAGCDSRALDDISSGAGTDWCAHGPECIDWKSRLKANQGPRTVDEADNFTAWWTRYKDLSDRWARMQERT